MKRISPIFLAFQFSPMFLAFQSLCFFSIKRRNSSK